MAIVRNVVLDVKSERILEELSTKLGKSRSKIIREAVIKYAEEVGVK